MDKNERIWKLLMYLRASLVPVSWAEIVRDTDLYVDDGPSSRKTFERDKKDLRNCGITIHTENIGGSDEAAGGTRYAIRDADLFLNLQLSANEGLALEMAATMVQFDAAWEMDALAKLGAGSLPSPPPLRAQLSAPEELVSLHNAVDRRRKISFMYGGASREVEPTLVFWRRGSWYIHGYQNGIAKNFKVDRFESDVIEGPDNSASSYEVPDSAEAMSEDPLLHGPDQGILARVLVDAVLARQVERDRGGVIERRDDGSVVVEVDVRSPGAFRSWLFGMRDHAVVLSPPQIVEDVISWLRALARAT
ncbi:MAG: WYL domain-containing protein [Actinomycetota bacterium]|nr:WYL domain-containing protein [Actinomycetota bacterium]